MLNPSPVPAWGAATSPKPQRPAKGRGFAGRAMEPLQGSGPRSDWVIFLRIILAVHGECGGGGSEGKVPGEKTLPSPGRRRLGLQGQQCLIGLRALFCHVGWERWAGESLGLEHRSLPCAVSRGAAPCGQHLWAPSLSDFQSEIRGQETELEKSPLKGDRWPPLYKLPLSKRLGAGGLFGLGGLHTPQLGVRPDETNRQTLMAAGAVEAAKCAATC